MLSQPLESERSPLPSLPLLGGGVVGLFVEGAAGRGWRWA